MGSWREGNPSPTCCYWRNRLLRYLALRSRLLKHRLCRGLRLHSGLGRRSFRSIFAYKAVDTTLSIHKLLASCEERMRSRTDRHETGRIVLALKCITLRWLERTAADELMPSRGVDEEHVLVLWMLAFLHQTYTRREPLLGRKSCSLLNVQNPLRGEEIAFFCRLTPFSMVAHP